MHGDHVAQTDMQPFVNLPLKSTHNTAILVDNDKDHSVVSQLSW